MNATTLYVEACKCMLSFESENPAVWDQLLCLLPKLRQALSCRICLELLIEPYGSHICQHYVCKGCLRKKRSLTPGCRWCSNLEKLTEDKQIKIVLACYQKLCEYIAQTPVGVRRLSTQNGEYSKTLAILQEAITSPISLTDVQRDQTQQVPVNEAASNSEVPSSSEKSVMASRSKVATSILPPEVKPLPKSKVTRLLSPAVVQGSMKPKKRRKKPFKGTYYNYHKKRKAVVARTTVVSLAKSEQEPSVLGIPETVGSGLPSELTSSKDENHLQSITEEGENEEIQVIDDLILIPEPKPEKVVITPPGKKRKYKGKLRKCKCGTSSKVKSTRCVSVRCPCFSDGGSCELCPCICCGNPFNNNNGKMLQ